MIGELELGFMFCSVPLLEELGRGGKPNCAIFPSLIKTADRKNQQQGFNGRILKGKAWTEAVLLRDATMLDLNLAPSRS